MAYDRYATQFTDKDGNVYGVMDEEARKQLDLVEGGYNPDMVVGGAEHLMSKDGVVDTTLYGLRRVPDGAGQAYLEKVVGGTVAWNQLVRNGNFDGTIMWVGSNASISASNNELTITPNSSSVPFIEAFENNTGLKAVNGNKYIISCDVYSDAWLSGSDRAGLFRFAGYWAKGISSSEVVNGQWSRIAFLFSSAQNTTSLEIAIRKYPEAENTITAFKARNFVAMDITKMFGPTIADAIYAMEQATAGAGVAWFRKLFPASYYAYNAGELISVNALSRRTVGFNQFDVSSVPFVNTDANNVVSGGIRVIPNQEYVFRHNTFSPAMAGQYIQWFDENGSEISSEKNYYNANYFSGTAPGNAITAKLKLYRGTGVTAIEANSADVCFSLSSDRNGEYEPYSAHTYPFADLTLRGIPKLENGELGYDGDTYLPDGTVTRRFSVVDLGTLNYDFAESNNIFYAVVQNIKTNTTESERKDGIICSKYSVSVGTAINNTMDDKSMLKNSGRIYIRDTSFSSSAVFRNAMSGVYLVYELATPITEQADPFNPFQILDPYGTEEFLSGTIVPVGHSTRYQADMVKTMQKEIDAALICPTASGAIASFADGADGLKLRELNVAVEPVQDLHGYDAPWPAGGGKNLLPTRATETINGVKFNTNSDGSVTLTGTATGGNAAFDVGRDKCTLPAGTYTASGTGTMSGASIVIYKIVSGTASVVLQGLGNFTLTEEASIFYRIFVASGTAVSGTCYPMICLSSASNPTTYEPYSNICPISGHTGAKVFRTGFNMWDGETESGYIYNGNYYQSNSYWRTKNFVPVSDNGTYYLKCYNHEPQVNCFDRNQNYIGFVTDVSWNANNEMTFSVLPNTCYIKFYQNALADKNTTYLNRFDASKNGTSEPYAGQTFDITFPSSAGTVYGGNLTLHQDGSGELVVDRAMITATRNNISVWRQDLSVFRIACSPKGTYLAGSRANKIANCLPTVNNNALYQGWEYGISEQNDGDIGLAVNGVTTLEAMGDWVEANNLQVCYKLATAITYTLTASQITTLLGTNNIWADCGDVSVTYPADTKLYIDGQQTEDDMTANTNIPNGYYFQVGNTLYKATAAIAQGETIIPGTNCTRTTFAEALNLLAAQ